MNPCDFNIKDNVHDLQTQGEWAFSDLLDLDYTVSETAEESVSFDDLYGDHADGSVYHDDMQDILAEEAGFGIAQSYDDVLAACLSLLSLSPAAFTMIKDAVKNKWHVSLRDLEGCDYELDAEQKLLVLDNHALSSTALAQSAYFRNFLLVTLTKALRDIWQEKRHGGFEKKFSPDYMILMERVRAADLDVMSVFSAWELRTEGYGAAWRHVIGSDIGDMAMTYSAYLERDPTSQFNGRAMRATFNQWFRDGLRIKDCDRETLDYMDGVLDSDVVGNAFGGRRPNKMDIEVISCLPDRSAYLQGSGAEILGNPAYTAMNDEINQTHLFHIMHDLEAVTVEDVPFRDADLARKIFPDSQG